MRWNLLARCALAAVPALFSGRAATPATSVFISSTAKSDVAAKPGRTQADTVASHMEIFAATALGDQYPCASAMRTSDVSDILGWERLKALLGNDPSSDAIQKIGGAIGAGYLLNFQVTQTGGQTTITGLGMNTGTGKVFARNTVTIPNDSGMVDAMQAFANSFVGSLGAGGPKCPPQWIGTISKTYERKTEESTKSVDKAGFGRSDLGTSHLENLVEAVLQPMSLGSKETNRPTARVAHKFEYHRDQAGAGVVLVFCRGGNVKSSWKHSEIEDENGQNTEVETVYINVNDGAFEISVQYPAVTTKWREEISNTPESCDGAAKTSTEASSKDGSALSEAYRQAGWIGTKGQIDGKDPNHLTGSQVTGDLESYGRTTLRWDLTLVKPKPGK